jgi:vitamin B12 transporter
MGRFIILILLLFVSFFTKAQVIKGTITDNRNSPIPNTNIYFRGSFEGTITGLNGDFTFNTSLNGKQILVVSFVGYKPIDTTLFLFKDSIYNLHLCLKNDGTELSEVVITAGTFEAGERKRGIQLKALDMLTTANSNGDIYHAVSTMPGAQAVGEEGALFVRGGEKYESKTFIDGLLVSNPYTSKVPDLPSRGRFTPSMFNGVSFSSGGYSAEYGQALSAILALQTNGFPDKSSTAISLMPFSCGIQHTWKGDSTALSGSIDYFNMLPYYSVIKQNTDWRHYPEDISSTLMYRKKIGAKGFLKSFGAISYNTLGLTLPDYLASNGNVQLDLKNTNAYLSSTYTVDFSSGWSMRSGIVFNYDDELVRFEHFSANTYNRVTQMKTCFQGNLVSAVSLKTGIDFTFQYYKQDYMRYDSIYTASTNFNNPLFALFAEAEWRISDYLFAKIGSRAEYSGLLNEATIVPRIAIALKVSEQGQFSAAYGIFRQQPKDDYVKFNSNLSSEKATHYIVNYQYEKNKRLFRIEAFAKEYDKLVRYTALNDPDPLHYNNNGHGYARGIELFMRDQQTLKNGDYWISYSYLDTRKLYQDYLHQSDPICFRNTT